MTKLLGTVATLPVLLLGVACSGAGGGSAVYSPPGTPTGAPTGPTAARAPMTPPPMAAQPAPRVDDSTLPAAHPSAPPGFKPHVVSSTVVSGPGAGTTTTQPLPPSTGPTPPPVAATPPPPASPPPFVDAPTWQPPAAPEPTAPPTSAAAAFRWAPSLAEAQAEARRRGVLIFLESGRDACGNCMKLKNEIIPSMLDELGTMSVGYYDDVERDKGSQAFWLLRNNLSTAVTMPLCGWFTPDLKWVHGFSGHVDVASFRRDIQRASSAYRSSGALPGETKETSATR
jgi:hypothetical protein